ncbi:hypothetical protein [Streptomyces sp. XD-27]|uniref:DUF7848 domain-containing protein n=1 Tax=Streptomyces sp. XD-27 TaxID=3062779 RepID=UPI0026F4488E|nr:hypothetical protein [Streptomyces sp. XD-27]WKX72403.1 hypothetical protein Q3Y56_23095 [Streptomyces sp. XD-27]
MDHAIIKGAEWVLIPETGEGAPEAIYGAQCIPCGRERWSDNDPRPVGVWAIDHTRTDPTHCQYLMTTHKHWRVAPNPSSQATPVPPTPPRATPQPRRTCHARPRPRLTGLKRITTKAARFVGLACLVALSVACGFAAGVLIATA